jgi:hypothetical protein
MYMFRSLIHSDAQYSTGCQASFSRALVLLHSSAGLRQVSHCRVNLV